MADTAVSENKTEPATDLKTEPAKKESSENGKDLKVENGGGDLTDLHNKIAKQLEYYFGNFNMGRDKFLKAQVQNNTDGWVTFETLLTFNRLKALTTDIDIVANAAKKADDKLIEVHEDGKKIRRNPENPIPELNEQMKEELSIRTVYLKKFPPQTTLDELLTFLKDYDVENIQMRKNFGTKTFRGSIFVTHRTKEAAEKLRKMEELAFGETTLIRETKEEYHKRKTEEKAKYAEEKERKRREKKTEAEPKENADKESEKTEESASFTPGLVVKITGVSNDTNLHDIRGFFETQAPVAWVDYNRGETDAWVRFEEKTAQEVIDKLKEKKETVELKGSQIELAVVEGEDETEYWKTVAKAKQDAKKRKRDFSDHRGGNTAKRRFRGGYKGRGGGRRN